MQHILSKTCLLIPTKVAHVHLTLIEIGELLHLALNIHGEGTNVHLHLAATLVSEREDAGSGVLCILTRGVHFHLPAGHHLKITVTLIMHHPPPVLPQDILPQQILKILLPFCMRCMKIRMNTIGRQMNNLHTLKEILSIRMLSQLVAV
jgi:hypothetical protein